MNKLTIKTITSTNLKKDGTPLIGKFGPYFLVRADTVEEGKVTWFSKTAHTHKEGDVIEGTLEVKTENGYTNKNFTFPKKDDVANERITSLEKRILKIEQTLEGKFADLKTDIVLEQTGKFMTDKDYKEMKDNYTDLDF